MSERPPRIQELLGDPVFLAVQVLLILRVVLAVVAFDPMLFDPFGLTKSVAAHLCSAVLAVALVWLVLRRGLTVIPWSSVHVGVGLLVLCFAAATFFALDREVALFGAWRRYLGLTQILDQAIVYVGAVVVARSRQGLAAMLWVGLAATIAVVAYGLLQMAHLDPIKYQDVTSRPISTVGNSDILGGCLSIAFTTIAAIVVLRWRQLPALVGAVALAVAAGCLVLLVGTGVRNGILGIGGGLVGAGSIALLWPSSVDVRRRLYAGGFAAAVILIVSLPLGGRLSPAFLQSDPAVQERLNVWRAATSEISDRLLLGVGPDNFGAGWPSVRSAASEQLIGPAQVETSTHGWPLYVLTSAGVLGLGAMLVIVVAAFSAALRLARRGDPVALAAVPLAAYLAQGLVDVNDISLDWVAWLAAGLLAGASSPAAVAVSKAQRRRLASAQALGAPSWLGWAAVALALAGGLAVGVPRLAASHALLLAEARLSVGAQQEAVAPASEAVRLDPRRAENWSSLGTALAGVNSPAAAGAFFQAAELAPWDRLHWMNIAITQRAIGNPAGALAAARKAVAADPSSAEARRLLASVLLDFQRFGEAAATGESALALYPGPQMYEEPILAYIKLERWDTAVALAQRAVTQTDSPHYRLRLAQALTGAGRIAEANDQLLIVLRATPNDAEAHALANFLASNFVKDGATSRPDLALWNRFAGVAYVTDPSSPTGHALSDTTSLAHHDSFQRLAVIPNIPYSLAADVRVQGGDGSVQLTWSWRDAHDVEITNEHEIQSPANYTTYKILNQVAPPDARYLRVIVGLANGVTKPTTWWASAFIVVQGTAVPKWSDSLQQIN